MANETILIVDDEKEIADLIEIHLVNEGYNVLKALNGEEALSLLGQHDVQLVILDIMMPGIDGLQVCRRIRKEQNIPILILSAKSQDMDKILGLSTGADDYLTKPFNVLELLARVKSQLRRYLYLNPGPSRPAARNTISLRGLNINQDEHSVSIFDREVSLTPTEFEILLLLASHPGRVFGTEEIFTRVWRERSYDANNTVMVHIRKIREKTEDAPSTLIYQNGMGGGL
jgi:DNA-binding response OmpR family regulator